MENLKSCPCCGISFVGEDIYQVGLRIKNGDEAEALKYAQDYGWTKEDPKHFGVNCVMIEVRGVYDGALYYKCTKCGYRYHRFPEGHYLHERAKPYVEGTVVDNEA